MRSGGCAGSGRALRLDPFGLPVRFSASDAAADGQVRDVELHRERVVLRRSLHGMRMALNMPVAAFDGISLWLVPAEDGAEDALAVVLKHRDPALTLPLFVTSQPTRQLAEWRAWSQVLGVPPFARGPERIFADGECAARRPARRTSASPPPPSERAQSAPSDVSSSARIRQDHQDEHRCIVASARSSRAISATKTALRAFAGDDHLHATDETYLHRCSFTKLPSCMFISM